MDIKRIRSLMNTGYLLANRYIVDITPPIALNTRWEGEKMRVIGDNCASVTLPGTSIETADWSNKGPVIKIPYRRTYNPLIINFYNDQNNWARAFFEDWTSTIFDNQSYNFRYRDEITANAKIYALDKYNNKVATYNVVGLIPTRLDDIPVSYQDTEVQRVAATLEYSYYTMESATGETVNN